MRDRVPLAGELANCGIAGRGHGFAAGWTGLPVLGAAAGDILEGKRSLKPEWKHRRADRSHHRNFHGFSTSIARRPLFSWLRNGSGDRPLPPLVSFPIC